MSELINTTVQIAYKIEEIKKQIYNARKKNKENFNFISAIISNKHGQEHIEKFHSNIIAYFLNPLGNHDCDDIFLKEFIGILQENSKSIQLPVIDLKKLSTHRERVIDNGRSIDISLEYKKEWIIFIENKINSGELHNQMKDYYDYASSFDNGFAVFLTKTGYEAASVKSIPLNKNIAIINLSYFDIIRWLENCLNVEEIKQSSKITEAIKQYINTIKKVLNIMEDKELDEIVSYITQNDDKLNDLIALYTHKDALNNAIDMSVKKYRENFHRAIVDNLLKMITNDKIVNISLSTRQPYNENNTQIILEISTKSFILNIDQSFPEYDDNGQGIWFSFKSVNGNNIMLDLKHQWWEELTYNFNNCTINDFLNTKESTQIILNNYHNKEIWDNIINQCVAQITQILTDRQKDILEALS